MECIGSLEFKMSKSGTAGRNARKEFISLWDSKQTSLMVFGCGKKKIWMSLAFLLARRSDKKIQSLSHQFEAVLVEIVHLCWQKQGPTGALNRTLIRTSWFLIHPTKWAWMRQSGCVILRVRWCADSRRETCFLESLHTARHPQCFFACEDKPDYPASLEKRKPCSSHASECCARELGGHLITNKPSDRGYNMRMIYWVQRVSGDIWLTSVSELANWGQLLMDITGNTPWHAFGLCSVFVGLRCLLEGGCLPLVEGKHFSVVIFSRRPSRDMTHIVVKVPFLTFTTLRNASHISETAVCHLHDALCLACPSPHHPVTSPQNWSERYDLFVVLPT